MPRNKGIPFNQQLSRAPRPAFFALNSLADRPGPAPGQYIAQRHIVFDFLHIAPPAAHINKPPFSLF